MDKQLYWELSKHARCPECESYLAYIPVHNDIDVKYFCPSCDYIETNGDRHDNLPGKKLEKKSVKFDIEHPQQNPGYIWGLMLVVLVLILYLVVNA